MSDVTNYYCPLCGKVTWSGDDHVCEFKVIDDGWGVQIWDQQDYVVADFITSRNPGKIARMFVSAPKLLSALRELVDIIDNGQREDIDSFTTQPARVAIAEAQGDLADR